MPVIACNGQIVAAFLVCRLVEFQGSSGIDAVNLQADELNNCIYSGKM